MISTFTTRRNGECTEVREEQRGSVRLTLARLGRRDRRFRGSKISRIAPQAAYSCAPEMSVEWFRQEP